MVRPLRAATPMAFVRAMVAAYEKYGIDPQNALSAAGVTSRQLRQEHARITAGQMELLSECAMRELDDEALGWFSRRLPWGSYGMLCRASLGSPNLGVALKRWCRHHRLLTDDVALHLRMHAGRVDIVIEERRAIAPQFREFCLLTLLRYVHGYACWAVDSRIEVLGVAFSHPAPAHGGAYALMFPGPVSFEAPATLLSLGARYMDLPIRRDEAALGAMLQRALVLTVRPYRRDRLLVRRMQELVRSRATADDLAEALHMSKRTLFRHLKEEGTSLQRLKDDARRESAIALLLRTDRSIKQVAHAAGFDNEKSFARAFRQWTGEAPSDYRRSRRPSAT